MSKDHEHAPGGPDDGRGGFDWFAALDVAVWVAVGVIAVLGAEWLIGYLVREKIAQGASRHLAKHAAGHDAGE